MAILNFVRNELIKFFCYFLLFYFFVNFYFLPLKSGGGGGGGLKPPKPLPLRGPCTRPLHTGLTVVMMTVICCSFYRIKSVTHFMYEERILHGLKLSLLINCCKQLNCSRRQNWWLVTLVLVSRLPVVEYFTSSWLSWTDNVKSV